MSAPGKRKVRGDTKKASALDQLRARRERGAMGLADVATADVDDNRIYDEVDEADYQLIVRKRLQEDDFVVDDDGLGYADHGGDDWDEERRYSSDDDAGPSHSKSAGKKKKKKTENHGQNIGTMLQKQALLASTKRNSVVGPEKKTAAGSVDDTNDDSLDALLNQIDSASAEELATRQAIKKKNPYSRPAHRQPVRMPLMQEPLPKIEPIQVTAAPPDDECSAQDFTEQDQEPVDSMPISTADNETPEVDDTPILEEPAHQLKVKVRSTKKPADVNRKVQQPSDLRKTLIPASAANVADAKGPMHPAVSVNNSDWWSARQNLADSPASQVYPGSIPPAFGSAAASNQGNFLQPNGSLLMYWLDACEGLSGIVYLFGKIYNKAENKFVSCCVSVTGMERSLYFLPRVRMLDAANRETDVEVDLQMLWEELDALFTRHNVKNWSLQEVQKKYAFEVPEIPVEADWVEVNYPFTAAPLQNGIKGKTFSNVFGTNTNALELLLLRANLMGPCWIEIKEPNLQMMGVSWCKTEATVAFSTSNADRLTANDVYNVRPVTDVLLDTGDYPEYCRSAPSLTVMSMALKTVMNYQKNVNEIVVVSALVYHKVSPDGATSDEDRKLVSTYTAIRQLGTNGVFPIGFADAARKSNTKIELSQTEKGLLNYILAIIHLCDPDVLVGHNFLGFDLDVLLHRMRDLGVDHWSRLGRVRRKIFPKLQSGVGGMGESTYSERMITSGRLIGDTYLAAKDLIKSKSYSLAQLSKDCLKVERHELDFERIPQFYSSAKDLVWLTQHCENDAFLSMGLAFHTMMIPLTKQLTNLAGNLWSRTMIGGRAERNEFLLLHEFYRSQYIVPDKVFVAKPEPVQKSKQKSGKGKKSAVVSAASAGTPPMADDDEQDDENDNVQEVKKAGKRKPAYSGGLVLEPKKGFYDKYVLMLDFNSLYPSIIQEFNICFTTVERKQSEDPTADEVPDLPDSSLEQGILPRLLATLVQRRRQVKSLMKNVDSKSAEYAQLNIRQQALKLTANSMYGCLGFTHSRFYAKPIAMLVTAKGREILQDTVLLAEQSLALEVIYGDTDSIMIHTATDDLAQVKKLGVQLKTAVNKKYKLLEIEMDGFFRRMLLLKKKKYAALTATEGSDGKLILARETKGLDLVRRDWCELSHEVSGYVLDQILSDKDREDVLNNIHTYLTTIGEEIRQKKIPLEKFVINKSLTKAPEEYNDAKSQPHVQVALRMKARGKIARVGDTIQYVICQDADAAKPYALRAYHLNEVSDDPQLEVDIDYYMNNQIHPPVARLCRPIEGTDDMRIASCLGLDPARYRGVSSVGRNDHDDDIRPLNSQMSDEERFKSAARLEVNCNSCSEKFKIEGVVRRQDTDYVSGLCCPKCNQVVERNVLLTTLCLSIRAHIRKYYEGWAMCEEPSCQYRTRQVSVNGRQCVAKFCRGTMHAEYSDGALYTQLLYYKHLFDADGAMRKYKNTADKEIVATIVRVYGEVYAAASEAVQSMLKHNARGFVDLKKMFCCVTPLGEQVAAR